MRKVAIACFALGLFSCARAGGDEGDAFVEPEDTSVRRDAFVPPIDAATLPVDAPRPMPDAFVPVDAARVDAARCDLDVDNDGYFAGNGCPSPDCDDMNTRIFPGAPETCDGRDQDCDTRVDEMLGQTNCGVGSCARTVENCMGGMPQTCAAGMPGVEMCDAMDNDCDMMTDEGFSAPVTCGIGACFRSVASCAGGTPAQCVPGMARPEQCNNIDDDCDTRIDEQIPDLVCGTGACRVMVAACVNNTLQTCTPGMPGGEMCNAIDDDCDGVVDNRLGDTTCGVGACRRTVSNCVGGAITTCTAGAPSAETCNGIDDDCNGMIDDGLGDLSCGVGACARTVPACMNGMAQTCMPGTPSAEICGNAGDENCDGVVGVTPPNASCAAPQALTVGVTATGDNSCGGGDSAAPSTCGGGAPGQDVVYRTTLPAGSGRYTFTMTGTGFNTVLYSTTDASCGLGGLIGCNDDVATGMTNVSRVVIDYPVGGDYYLVADSAAAGAGGAFTLQSAQSVIDGTTNIGEACADPIVISRNGAFTGVLTGYANDLPSGVTLSCTSGGAGGPDLTFALTARSTGMITVDTVGSSYDTVLYVGTTCGNQQRGCHDDITSGSNRASRVTFAATAGTTYYITLDAFSSTTSGNWTLNVAGL